MVILFYILVFLSIWHFFYESVLASSLRHGLRYKFFELRDELRNIKIDGLSKHDEKVFEVLDNSICHIINSMSFISLSNYYKLKKFYDIKEVRESIVNTKKLISESDNNKLKHIDDKISELGSNALAINNGSWILYFIVPLFVLFIISIFNSQFNKLSNLMNKVSSRLIYSSDNFEDSSHIGLV